MAQTDSGQPDIVNVIDALKVERWVLRILLPVAVRTVAMACVDSQSRLNRSLKFLVRTDVTQGKAHSGPHHPRALHLQPSP